MKRTVLFGAGASIEFFNPVLSTAYLTSRISDKNLWDNLVKRYNRLMNGTNEVDSAVVNNTIGEIIRINPKLNFEQIIEIIDKISSFNFERGIDSKIFHHLLKFYKVQPDFKHVWDNVPFLCRQLIAESIIDFQNYYKVPTYDHWVQMQADFFDYITTTDGLSLISLNYDDIICQSLDGKGFQNGFIGGSFNPKDFLNSSKSISFPHGHLRFIMTTDGVVYYSDSNLANKNRLDKLPSIALDRTEYMTDSPYCYNFNTFLVTGQAKESTFDNNPYSAYYQKIAFDFLTSDEIIIIGYSFGDNHFNRLLLNFCANNPANKVIIIGKFGSIDINDYYNVNSPIHKLLSLFTGPSIVLTSSGTYKYKYQSGVDDINNNNWGMLHPQIYLYKDGYINFLNTYKTTI